MNSICTAGSADAEEPHGAGAARRWASAPHLLAALLAPLAAVTLHGCEAVGHPASAWEMKPSYVATYAYLPAQEKLPAGQLTASHFDAILNSCELRGQAEKTQCSGHGYCKNWPAAPGNEILSFCECDRDWADPECRTQRKSQAYAFTLSLFAGYAGVDHFYLGEYYTGLIKLGTLGGLGLWWVLDIVRLGSAPVYASSGFRLAADLPHWIYVGSVIVLFGLIGYFFFTVLNPSVSKQRKLKKAMLQAEEDFFKTRSATADINANDTVGMPVRSSYHVPLPTGFSYGTMIPEEVRRASFGNPMASYSVFNDQQARAAGDAAAAGQEIDARLQQATPMTNPAEAAAAPAGSGATPPPTPPGSDGALTPRGGAMGTVFLGPPAS